MSTNRPFIRAIVHDATGEALQTLRYGAVPTSDPVDLFDRVLADVTTIHAERPDLSLVSLRHGAPEMRTLLRSALDATVLGTPGYEVLDFWHLLEKLAPAAQLLYGAPDGQAVLRRWRVDLLNRNAAPDEILDSCGGRARRTFAWATRALFTRRSPTWRTIVTAWLSRCPAPRAAAWQRQHRSDVQESVHTPAEARWGLE